MYSNCNYSEPNNYFLNLQNSIVRKVDDTNEFFNVDFLIFFSDFLSRCWFSFFSGFSLGLVVASFRVLKRWSKQIRENKGRDGEGREEEEETEGRGHAHARAAVTNSITS
jgi:MFS superfamily sulfate permease-like transporter